MNFATWLQAFMKQHNIRQCHIIKKSGIHANLLYWWLQDRNTPSAYNLAILATTLSNLTDIERPVILEHMCCAILKG